LKRLREVKGGIQGAALMWKGKVLDAMTKQPEIKFEFPNIVAKITNIKKRCNVMLVVMGYCYGSHSHCDTFKVLLEDTVRTDIFANYTPPSVSMNCQISGLFVGFGGLKIKQLEKHLRCYIVVDSSKRTITVYGVDGIPDDNVVEMIKFFADPQPLATRNVGPADEVKRLKGKRGENARELMEQTGLWITFANDELHTHLQVFPTVSLLALGITTVEAIKKHAEEKLEVMLCTLAFMRGKVIHHHTDGT